MAVRSTQLASKALHLDTPIARPDYAYTLFFRLLIALTLVRAVLYALLNPPFGSPDEIEHFRYVAHLATSGASGNPGTESQQPTLYYALMVPAYLATLGHSPAVQLLAIRLSSAVFLLGTVWLVRELARVIAPNRPSLQVVVTSIVALSPESTVIAASANNDAITNLAGALLALLSARLILRPRATAAMAMLLGIGLALATKGIALPMIAAGMFALALYLGDNARSLHRRHALALVAVAAVAVVLPLRTESVQIALGRANSAMMLVGQEWQEPLRRVIAAGRWPWVYQFETFWGAFVGDVVMPAVGWYLAMAAMVGLALAGHASSVLRFAARRPIRWTRHRTLMSLFALAFLLQWLMCFTVIVGQGARSFGDLRDQTEWSLQGRYLLPALAPFAVLVAEGLRKLSPTHMDRWLPFGIPALMLALDFNSLLALATQYTWPIGAYGDTLWK